MGVLSNIDPTGITNIIKAFIAPSCNFKGITDEEVTKFSVEPARHK